MPSVSRVHIFTHHTIFRFIIASLLPALSLSLSLSLSACTCMLHSLTLDRSRVFSWRSHLDSHSSTSPLMCNTITIVHEFEFLIDRRFTLCRPVSGTFVEFCQLISFVCNNNVCAVSLRTARSNGITFYPCGFNGTRVLCRIYVRFTATHARIGNYFLLSSR